MREGLVLVLEHGYLLEQTSSVDDALPIVRYLDRGHQSHSNLDATLRNDVEALVFRAAALLTLNGVDDLVDKLSVARCVRCDLLVGIDRGDLAVCNIQSSVHETAVLRLTR